MLLRRTLSTLAVVALGGTALLVPSTASAKPPVHSPWSDPPSSRAHAQRASLADLHWSVLNHEIVVTDASQGIVPIVYRCAPNTDGTPKSIRVSPGIFQKVYTGASTAAFDTTSDGSTLPTLTCDDDRHIVNFVFHAVIGSFQYGNVEVGLYRTDSDSDSDTESDPAFEHAVVGYGPRDGKTPVTVTANAAPEVVKAGKKITITGSVKRQGKAYTDKTATLYYQPDSAPASAITTDKVDKSGNVSASVKAQSTGSFFWTIDSTRSTRAGASWGDHIEVVTS